jgi:hypothetical protein
MDSYKWVSRKDMERNGFVLDETEDALYPGDTKEPATDLVKPENGAITEEGE